MRTDLFDFELPADRIALRPASPRDSARMLVVQPGAACAGPHRLPICRLWLEPGDQLVVNDTKVIAGATHRPPHRPRHRTEDRGDADQAARRLALAGAGQAGEEAVAGRRRSLRQ